MFSGQRFAILTMILGNVLNDFFCLSIFCIFFNKISIAFHFFEWLQFLSTFWVNLLFPVLFFLVELGFFLVLFFLLLLTQNLCLQHHHTRPVGNSDSIFCTHTTHFTFTLPTLQGSGLCHSKLTQVLSKFSPSLKYFVLISLLQIGVSSNPPDCFQRYSKEFNLCD